MTESDDALGLGGGPDIPDMPAVRAGPPKKTAEPLKQLSEQAKKNRQLAASFLTRGFTEPSLSEPGLRLGL